MEAPTPRPEPQGRPLAPLGDVKRHARRRQWEREYKLRTRYGVDYPEWKRLKAAQNNLCAICRKRAAVVVDHDHLTGRVRGILCRGCNRALGTLGDGLEGVLDAVAYLLPHSFHRG